MDAQGCIDTLGRWALQFEDDGLYTKSHRAQEMADEVTRLRARVDELLAANTALVDRVQTANQSLRTVIRRAETAEAQVTDLEAKAFREAFIEGRIAAFTVMDGKVVHASPYPPR
jgi:uncharacterized protein YoxC